MALWRAAAVVGVAAVTYAIHRRASTRREKKVALRGSCGGERTTLYCNIRLLVTMADEDVGEAEIEDAFILVAGCRVARVGRMCDAPEASSVDHIVDMTDRVVIPGLVNTHHHMFQSLARCTGQDQGLFGWLKQLYPIFLLMTSEDIYVSAKTIMAEMVLSGCTLTSDHLYAYPNDVTLDDEIRAAQEIGIRFHAARGAMSVGESNGGLPPDALVEKESDILKDMKRLVEQYHDSKRYSMLRIVLAPCSPFTVSVDLMKRSAELAREYPGVFLHTHLAEDDNDISYSLEKFGMRPGEYIKSVGWVGHDVWHAHCCKLSPEELKLFADTGTGLSHCPSSNLRLGSGVAPVVDMLNANVKVSIGVDGSASNDSGHVLNEVRMAMLLQRIRPEGAAALSARRALRLATRGGAEVLGRPECGWIGEGSAADFVAWRLDTLAFAGSHHDLVSALVFCLPNCNADVAVINGRQVVKKGRLVTVDVPALIKRHNELSRSLFHQAEALGQSPRKHKK